MEASSFDEAEFFQAIAASGARALLIGRRALIALGLPVLTADYDYWLHIDDMDAFNDAAAPFDLRPSCAAAEARKRGRYVLENDERVDVLIARAVGTRENERVTFDDVWARRVTIAVHGAAVCVPNVDDLIATKKFGARPRDADDIRLLEGLRARLAARKDGA